MGVAFCAPVVGEIGNRTGFTTIHLYIEQAIEEKKKHKNSIVIAKKNDVHIEKYGFSYNGSWFFTTPPEVNQFRPSPKGLFVAS